MVRFPPVSAGDDIVLSASTYTAYRRCPEQAAARLRGEYGAATTRGFVGGLAHRMFARHLTAGPVDPAGFEAACREEIGAGLNPGLAELRLKPSDLGRVMAEVGLLYDRFTRFPTDGFEGAEVAVEAEPADGVTLRGVIDAVFTGDGGVRLVDWKTGAVPPESDQLDFYVLVWTLARGAPPGSAVAVSVATGEQRPAVITTATLETTAARAGEAVDALRRAWRGGPAPVRRGGPWCRYCPVLATCPEGAAAQPAISNSTASDTVTES